MAWKSLNAVFAVTVTSVAAGLHVFLGSRREAEARDRELTTVDKLEALANQFVEDAKVKVDAYTKMSEGAVDAFAKTKAAGLQERQDALDQRETDLHERETRFNGAVFSAAMVAAVSVGLRMYDAYRSSSSE